MSCSLDCLVFLYLSLFCRVCARNACKFGFALVSHIIKAAEVIDTQTSENRSRRRILSGSGSFASERWTDRCDCKVQLWCKSTAIDSEQNQHLNVYANCSPAIRNKIYIISGQTDVSALRREAKAVFKLDCKSYIYMQSYIHENARQWTSLRDGCDSSRPSITSKTRVFS